MRIITYLRLKKKKKKDTTSLLVACLSEHKVLIVFDHKR